jgi:ABC-type transport system involved in cytochrome bd biosynthesis fused ATPase/permease subunit
MSGLKQDHHLIEVEKIERKDILLENINIVESGILRLKIDSMKFTQNEKVFIKGHSGAGKSTLIDLMLGYRVLPSGSISIGGYEVGSFNLNKYISYLGSEVPFISGTIRDNINLGISHSDKDLAKALAISGFDKILSRSEMNLDSAVNTNEIVFSQGERQKLNLTRVIAEDAPILLLDEATNSIDIDEEKNILLRLMDEFPDKLIIFISHKDRNSEIFNKVISISNGKILP